MTVSSLSTVLEGVILNRKTLDPVFFFFFFKQKTAYEIGTGDWSSDVCSSDLVEIKPIAQIPLRGYSIKQAVSKLVSVCAKTVSAICFTPL